jgi:hypothetical protein
MGTVPWLYLATSPRLKDGGRRAGPTCDRIIFERRAALAGHLQMPALSSQHYRPLAGPAIPGSNQRAAFGTGVLSNCCSQR